MSRRLPLPAPATVLAGAALFIALGGPAEAQRLVETHALKRNSVKSRHIANRTIAFADLSAATVRQLRTLPAGSIGSHHVADGALAAVDLAPASVTGDRLAVGAVGSAAVADQSLVGLDIATDAISSDEIANNSLVGADIRDGSIDSGEVVDGGLNGKDVGRYVGALELNFSEIASNGCGTVQSTALTGVIANQNLGDDVIVVTPPAGFPDKVSVRAQPLSANQIAVTVCNHSGGPLTPGNVRFRYLTIDTDVPQ